MISLEDVPEMIEDLNAGNLTLQNVYSLCLDLFEHHEVSKVLALLPDELRGAIETKMRVLCDNDVPPEDFLLLSSARGDHPAKLIIVERVRRWLKSQGARS